MVTDDLLSYIRLSLGQGKTPSQIRSALSAQGWYESDISEGLKSIEGKNSSTPTSLEAPQAEILPVEIPKTNFPWTFVGILLFINALGCAGVLTFLSKPPLGLNYYIFTAGMIVTFSITSFLVASLLKARSAVFAKGLVLSGTLFSVLYLALYFDSFIRNFLFIFLTIFILLIFVGTKFLYNISFGKTVLFYILNIIICSVVAVLGAVFLGFSLLKNVEVYFNPTPNELEVSDTKPSPAPFTPSLNENDVNNEEILNGSINNSSTEEEYLTLNIIEGSDTILNLTSSLPVMMPTGTETALTNFIVADVSPSKAPEKLNLTQAEFLKGLTYDKEYFTLKQADPKTQAVLSLIAIKAGATEIKFKKNDLTATLVIAITE